MEKESDKPKRTLNHCIRCSWDWFGKNSLRCPKCGSPYWNKEKTRK